MSQRQDKGPPSRLRRISLLPNSITSASLSHKTQQSTSSFAPPTSSPARDHHLKSRKTNAIPTGNAIKRRTSCSTLPVTSSTLSSTMGKRRVNAAPPDKNTLASDDKPAPPPSGISEFGAFQKVTSESTAIAPPRRTSIRPRHTVSGQAPLPPNSSLRLSTLPTARSGLRPSTAGSKPPSSEAFPLQTSLSSNIPRPRVGSSTPTRASIVRQGSHVKAASCVSIPSKSPSFQLKPIASKSNTTLASSKSSFSVKSRAAVWGRISASCSSPSPSTRQKSTLQSTPTAKSTRESRPADPQAGGSQPQPLPDRSRRSFLMPHKVSIPQLDPVRSRRSSLVPLRPSASANVAVTAPFQLERKSSKPAVGSEEDLWGRWKASTPAQCDNREQENGIDRHEQYNEDSRESLCANDFINASMLLDGKILDELDAEVGRLGLDESTMAVEYIDDEDLEKEKLQKELLQKVEEMKQREMLLDAMSKQRDEALYRETQAKKELEAVNCQVESYRAATEEAERTRQRRKEMASQTIKESKTVEPNEADVHLQKQAEIACITVARLALESICQEWKHATNLACSHVTSLEGQSEICSYFLAQLDMFQVFIEKVQCNDE